MITCPCHISCVEFISYVSFFVPSGTSFSPIKPSSFIVFPDEIGSEESEQATKVNGANMRIVKIMDRIKTPPFVITLFITIATIFFARNAFVGDVSNMDLIERITQNFIPAAQEIGKKLEVYTVRLFSSAEIGRASCRERV